ncbi:putative transposase-associated domain-containing protein [Tanacetum coccineum]
MTANCVVVLGNNRLCFRRHDSLVRDAFVLSSSPLNHENTEEEMLDGEEDESVERSDHNVEDIPYKKLLEQCDEELYPGCKFSSLSFTLRLYHIKCIGGISNKAFGMILELLRDAFPHITSLPSSAHQTKKLTNDLGLGYKKIHACPNDCMLYWVKSEGEQSCHTCKASQYRVMVINWVKVQTHASQKSQQKYPGDGLAWKAFNGRYPKSALDPRSVRLGLASDGCNPFRTMNTQHSTWPVLLIPYNLPPWICMKQQSFILSAIIQGEKGLGNDIDVYLQPLRQELNLLWKGVDAYDAFSKERFKLRASLLWTINDFPAYANLFDGTIKVDGPPTIMSGSDILKQLRGSSFKYGKLTKSNNKRRRDDVGCSTSSPLPVTNDESSAFDDIESFIEEDIDGDNQLWKKRSIFFDLPYWEFNLIRHNLDVMHIEKNVFDNLIGTLLNLDGKTKDNENARKDMGIRHELHLINRPNKKSYMPLACYTMTNAEKSNFLQVLKDLKVPDGYSSNISRGVSLKDRKLFNLKSHDAHIMMQGILVIVLKASMHSRAQTRVVKAVSDLCSFFKGLCAKVLDPSELDKMEYQVVRTLCELEQLFPPSFFTIMVHLTIHLISEAKLGGPVHYRWMYPIERYLMRLKSYVRNKAQPEGSMAEGYVKDECLTFCSRYFEGVETPFNRPPRNDETIYGKEMYMLNSGGRKLGKVDILELDYTSLAQAHRYVLLNHSKIQPFRDHFLGELRALKKGPVDLKTIEKLVVEEFPGWLQLQVPFLEKNNFDKEVLSLAIGPSNVAKQCNGFITNGLRFLTKSHEEFKKTQNSGVMVEVEGGNYYGKLTSIIELEYVFGYKVVLFRCDWVDIRPSRGLKKDKYGFPLVNFSRPLVHTGIQLKDDPFIVSSQAKQVFYIEDVKDVGWLHVNMNFPRDTYDMGKNVIEDDDDSYIQCNFPDLGVIFLMTVWCCKSYLQVLFLPFKLLFLLFPDHLKQEFTATWKMFRSKATME